ncbi:MAG: NAD(P)H-dependent oxidoreductase subunit E [Bryobacteraceae bacterium]|jgi:NADH-quinone oxidoreductase subunit E
MKSQSQLTLQEQDFVDRLIAEHSGRPGALLTILEKVQERHPSKYLSGEVLEHIAAKTDIPLAQLQSVVTFYALFNLDPQGANTICVCRGTACHTRGSRGLLERLKLEMGLNQPTEEPEADKLSLTTPDRKYTIRTVACFGQCALAPVVEINHSIFGHMNERALRNEIDVLEKESGD